VNLSSVVSQAEVEGHPPWPLRGFAFSWANEVLTGSPAASSGRPADGKSQKWLLWASSHVLSG
jgi:hypothetical protein